MEKEHLTVKDMLTYDFASGSEKFALTSVPAEGSIRFFINGVCYTEKSGAFTRFKETINDEDHYYIIWAFSANRGGFDLLPEWHYMAVYESYLEDNISSVNIERALNALILINPDLLRTDFEYDKSKEKELVNYIASQVANGNLTYKAITNLYPDLKSDISNALIANSGRNDYMTDALNVLLMINPSLLHSSLTANDFDMDLVYKYVKYQISIGGINEEEFYKRFPHFLMKLD